jgi:RimJ/RimL family protein N-acetyltransferase
LIVTIDPLTPADFPMVAGWSDPSTNEWLTSDWRGRRIDAPVIAIAARNKTNRLWLARCDGQPAGLVGLSDIDAGDAIANVWYLLGEREFAGKGKTVHAWIMENNVGSRRVLEPSGFRPDRRLRSAAAYRGQRVDRIYFDLVKSER